MAAAPQAPSVATERRRADPVAIVKKGGGSRIPSLDGMRAISICLVLVGHLAGTRGFFSERAVSSLPFGSVAHLGVRVFFVISGFLITSLLLHEIGKTGKVDLGGFYVRRVFRIFPAFYAYLAVLLVVTAVGWLRTPARDAIVAATYLMNFDADRVWHLGHLWSLSVEEQFYLLWPATLRILGVRRGLLAAALVMVAAPLFRIGWFYALPQHVALIGEAFPTVMDSIAAGCLLAGVRARLDARPAWRWLMSTPLLAALPVALLFLNGLSDHARPFWLVGDTCLNVGIAVLVARCIRSDVDLPGRILNARPLAFVGTLSYSIYLWQQPFLNRASGAFVTGFPQNLACVAALALASYYLVERPFLHLRERRRWGSDARRPIS